MRIVRAKVDEEVFYGVLEQQTIKRLAGAPYEGIKYTGQEYARELSELLAPCEPSKIVAVGLNYKNHAKELSFELPKQPVIFLKPTTALLKPGGVIVHPQAAQRVDYEGELAVVIGKTAKDIESAQDYIFGYTIANDVTARDMQAIDGQWARAKGFDTFCPLGEYIQTDIDVSDAQITTRLNEQIVQQDRTSNMIFSPEYIVKFVSGIMTLFPGDVILLGTPSGIGKMNIGDTVEISIQGLGKLINIVGGTK